MTELILKLLGARVDQVHDVTGASLAWRGVGSLGWVLLALAALGVGIWWLHRRSGEPSSRQARAWLVGLRVTFLALLLVLFLRPVLALTVEGSIRRLLLVLVDGSASLQIADPRVDKTDRVRAALGKGLVDPTRGLEQSLDPRTEALVGQVPRVDLLKGVLANRRLDLLRRLQKDFDVSVFSFGEGLAELPVMRSGEEPGGPADPPAWVAGLEAKSPVTALGDALQEVSRRKRGQPLAGIVLMTDGVNNRGSQPQDALLGLQSEHIPVYAYGLGLTSPRDVIVENLFAPDVVFVRDEATVSVRVRAQGLAGQHGEVHLKLAGETVARAPVHFAGNGDYSVPLSFTPLTEGEFELEASVPPRPMETVTNNNFRAQRVRVVDARIRVLLVEQAPRWEFRYLQAMLLRDRRVELKCYLVEGDPGIARGAGSPYLSGFPSRKEDLFRYDVVVLGDIDPQRLSTAHLENLSEWVSRFGGALLVVAGKRWTPQAYRRGPLEKLLPVELELVPAEAPAATRPIRLELTPAGQTSPVLRLAEEDNPSLWAGLPPVYWVARVARAKPAAQVLLVDPDPSKETRFGKMPVLALQQYGLGQVLFLGTDNTWRWRKNVGEAHYTAFWGQTIQRLSLQRLLGGSKRTQLSTDRRTYFTGDRITVYGRLYSAGYDPVQDPEVEARYGLKNGLEPRSQVLLRALPEQPGLYRGEFVAPAPGQYQLAVQLDPETQLDLEVAAPRFEFGDTAMNEPLLRELAQGSGGAFLREEDLHRLPDLIRSRTDRVRSYVEVDLWSSPLYFLVLLTVLTTEWLLRKRFFLK